VTEDIKTGQKSLSKVDFKEIIAEYKDDLQRVEKGIADNFQTDVTIIPKVSSYLTAGGGKRIRPLLLIASAKLCGYTGASRYIKHSVVVEYIHTATLLHDDVVDEADMRRGGASANIKFGNQASVLVGDFLFAKSFQIMSEDNDIRVIQAVSRATRLLAEGEVLQLVNTMNTDITEKEYLETIYRKTGALIETCLIVGAILGGAPKESELALAEYGRNIGLAFQLVDDALDYAGQAQTWGKPLGADISEGKITMPLIHALKLADKKEKEVIHKALETDKISKLHLEEVIEIMNRHKTLAYTMNQAREYVNMAKKLISGFPPSAGLTSLCAIADYIVDRDI